MPMPSIVGSRLFKLPAPRLRRATVFKVFPAEICEINITSRRLLIDTFGQQFVHSRHQAI
jgi:hypothetical protein